MDSSDFIVQLARQTGELLLEYFKQNQSKVGLQMHLKPDQSVVTEADLAADHMIWNAITKEFPGEAIISEETQPASQSENNVLSEKAYSRSVWVIDPLDGTTNFSLGLYYWGVLITRLEAGWPEETALYFPLLGEMYTAQRNSGAFLNGECLHTASSFVGRTTPFFACCSRTFDRYQIKVPYKPRILGSAAYSLCCVARGIALASFEAAPKVWDIAGGWLIIQEAGGAIQVFDGNNPFPLRSGIAYEKQSFPVLAAINRKLITQTQGQINPR
jgi:myo-inositol-1(or 4)-monophosphatase